MLSSLGVRVVEADRLAESMATVERSSTVCYFEKFGGNFEYKKAKGAVHWPFRDCVWVRPSR